MSDKAAVRSTLYCDFCGKGNDDAAVTCLIAADSCSICDKCVDLCADIVRSRREAQASQPTEPNGDTQ